MKLLRAIAFWFATAAGVIVLSGLYATFNPEAPTTTPIWRQS
ncbi:hypothetical protein [Cupriavidus pauculus]|nr:hypothetical protein [Cupriavidus pauculus]